MITFLSGLWLPSTQDYFRDFHDAFNTWSGLGIAFRRAARHHDVRQRLGVIWPAEKIVIDSSTAVAGGADADPQAADAAKRAARASRVNTARISGVSAT
jgi:hypothetical protein